MRALPILFALAFLVAASGVASGHAPVTKSCELIPHGFIVGGNTNGCALTGAADQLVFANVTVIGGTVDAIEIDIAGGGLAPHVFVCTFAVVTSACALPVQPDVGAAQWTVTARILAADPLGDLFGGCCDTYARLDATFI